MSLIQLIYTSTLQGEDESVLASIHSHAVRNNTAVTITGMLIFYKGRFLQILEGDKNTVNKVYEKIKHDPRHENIELVLERDVAEHYFDHWNMGFKHLQEDELVSKPLYKNYLESEFLMMKQNPEMALTILTEIFNDEQSAK